MVLLPKQAKHYSYTPPVSARAQHSAQTCIHIIWSAAVLAKTKNKKTKKRGVGGGKKKKKRKP